MPGRSARYLLATFFSHPPTLGFSMFLLSVLHLAFVFFRIQISGRRHTSAAGNMERLGLKTQDGQMAILAVASFKFWSRGLP